MHARFFEALRWRHGTTGLAAEMLTAEDRCEEGMLPCDKPRDKRAAVWTEHEGIEKGRENVHRLGFLEEACLRIPANQKSFRATFVFLQMKVYMGK